MFSPSDVKEYASVIGATRASVNDSTAPLPGSARAQILNTMGDLHVHFISIRR